MQNFDKKSFSKFPYIIIYNNCEVTETIISQLPSQWRQYYAESLSYNGFKKLCHKYNNKSLDNINKFYNKHKHPKEERIYLRSINLSEIVKLNLLPSTSHIKKKVLFIFNDPVKRALTQNHCNHKEYATLANFVEESEDLANEKKELRKHHLIKDYFQHEKIELPGSWDITIILDRNLKEIKKWLDGVGLDYIKLPEKVKVVDDPKKFFNDVDLKYIHDTFHRDWIMYKRLIANNGKINTRHMKDIKAPEYGIKFFHPTLPNEHNLDVSFENIDHHIWSFERASEWIIENFCHNSREISRKMVHWVSARNFENFELLFALLFLWKIGGYYRGVKYEPGSSIIFNKYSNLVALHPDKHYTFDEI